MEGDKTKILQLLTSKEEKNWLLGMQLACSLFGVKETCEWLLRELDCRISNISDNFATTSLAGFTVILQYAEHLYYQANYPNLVVPYVSIIMRMGAFIPHTKEKLMTYFNDHLSCLYLINNKQC